MIYPKGHAIRWRADIPARPGSQTGKLARDWERVIAFPWVIWDGEEIERQCLPECVSPAPLAPAQLVRVEWSARQNEHAKPRSETQQTGLWEVSA